MSLNIFYEIIRIHQVNNTIEVLYSAPEKPSILLNLSLTGVSGDVVSYIKSKAPISYWDNLSKAPPLVDQNIKTGTLEYSKEELLVSKIKHQVQSRLDSFAQTKGYDSMLSACSYLNSPTQKFHEEAARCIHLRDTTWAATYKVLQDIQDELTPVPSSISDIEHLLPQLTW